jgi:WD40 repeat protein
MKFIESVLQKRLARATYDQQQKDDCHEVTRDRVLSKLDEWLSVPSDDERCLWVTGQPGVGKSAIAITVAECLLARRKISAIEGWDSESDYSPKATLYGQFFINHTISESADPNCIFPTIALQLTTVSPLAAVVIHEALVGNVTLADKLTKAQVNALFVRPLSILARHDPGVAAVLFDGIDELSKNTEQALSDFTSTLSAIAPILPPNVKLLVFSRPETYITKQLVGVPSVVSSHLLTEVSCEDVQRLLETELQSIATLHQLSEWPLPEQVGMLCDHADGHLGWAALAVRWIGREVGGMGDTTYTRETVFDDVRKLRKGNMYDLYSFILDRVVQNDAKEEQLMGCRKTLGILACQYGHESIRTLTILINLGRSFDVVHFFRRISSVIVSNFDVIDEETVPQPHKTFIDWIFFKHSVSGNQFQVDIGLHLATRCIDIMNSELHFNMANVHSSAPYHRAVDPDRSQTLIPHSAIPAHIRYVCQNGFSHFYNHPTDNDEDNVLSSFVCQYTPKLEFFLQNTLLYWLEVTNDSFDTWNDIWHLRQHNLILQDRSTQVQSLLIQVERFIWHFGFGFAHNPPHIYVSALPFLPLDSLISTYHRATYSRTLNVKYDQDPQEMMTIYAAVVKGSLVAAISCPYSILVDSTLPEEYIFPATVLNVYNTRQKGRSLEVFSIPLSPVKVLDNNVRVERTRNHTIALDLTTDGKYVAPGYDLKIEVWNIDDGSSTVFYLMDDDSRTAIACLAFSPDRSRLAAGCYDGSVCVWDLKNRDSKRQFQCYENTMIRTILFSCTDKSRMIIQLDGHRIYDFELDGDSRSTTNIPRDARLVSFASSDWAAYKSGDDFGFFECKNWNTYKMKLTNHVQYRTSIIQPRLGGAATEVNMHSIGVSSDGRIAVIGDGFLLSVWDVKADRFLGHLVGHSHSILAIAVQVLKSCDKDSGLNGKYSCTSVSRDGTIRVWDLNPLLEGETYFMKGWTSSPVNHLWATGEGPRQAQGSWIKNEEGDYLFSLPLHCLFRHPLNTLVIGQCPELDMTHFVYGEAWTKCREPILEIEDEGNASGLASEPESGKPGPSNDGN